MTPTRLEKCRSGPTDSDARDCRAGAMEFSEAGPVTAASGKPIRCFSPDDGRLDQSGPGLLFSISVDLGANLDLDHGAGLVQGDRSRQQLEAGIGQDSKMSVL